MKSYRFFLLVAALSAGVFSAVISCHHDSMPTEPVVAPTATPRPGTTAPPATSTPVLVMTPTPVPAMTPTPSTGTASVSVGAGGANAFVDSHSGSSTTTVSVGATVTWTWSGGFHSTTSGNCCTADGIWNSGAISSGSFSHTFSSAGTFPYFCLVHGSMMTGKVVVNP